VIVVIKHLYGTFGSGDAEVPVCDTGELGKSELIGVI